MEKVKKDNRAPRAFNFPRSKKKKTKTIKSKRC